MPSILSDKIEKKIFSSRVPITTGKGNSCSTRPSKAKPFGFVEKIILARRACGIFSRSLACTEHDLLKPVVMGTPAPKCRTNKY